MVPCEEHAVPVTAVYTAQRAGESDSWPCSRGGYQDKGTGTFLAPVFVLLTMWSLKQACPQVIRVLKDFSSTCKGI